MSERIAPTRTPAFEARLKKRYASERRFRALGLSAVPVLDGALETSAAGLLSSLHPHNVRLRRAVVDVERAALDPRYPLLYDPQTAGGLLAGVPGDRADACVDDFSSERSAMIDVGVRSPRGATWIASGFTLLPGLGHNSSKKCGSRAL